MLNALPHTSYAILRNMTVRSNNIARVGRLYKFIDNGGICVYCGVPATTTDHFAPISVVSSLIGIVDFASGKYTIPSCGECNSISGSKTFNTIGAKRRYIQQRLRKKYRRVLNSPEWCDSEMDCLGFSLKSYVKGSLSKKEWMQRRVTWKNTNNPESVKLAEIRLKLGVFGKGFVPDRVETSGTHKKERKRLRRFAGPIHRFRASSYVHS